MHISSHIGYYFFFHFSKVQAKIYSLNSLQVCTALLLTMITMLYIRSPEPIHLITGSLYPLISFTKFSGTHALGNIYSVSISFFFFFFFFAKFQIKVRSYSICLCLIYCNKYHAFKSIYVYVNGRISFFSMVE